MNTENMEIYDFDSTQGRLEANGHDQYLRLVVGGDPEKAIEQIKEIKEAVHTLEVEMKGLDKEKVLIERKIIQLKKDHNSLMRGLFKSSDSSDRGLIESFKLYVKSHI